MRNNPNLDKEKIKRQLKGKEPIGVLFYYLMQDGTEETKVLPYSVKKSLNLIQKILGEKTFNIYSMFIVSLGPLKREIDKAIDQIPVRERKITVDVKREIDFKYQIFYSSDVVKICGLTQRQIIHLSERGFVSPIIDARGIGSRRAYTYGNLLEFGLIKSFLDRGVGLHKIKDFTFTLMGGPEGLVYDWGSEWDDFYEKKAEEYIKNNEHR